MKLWVCIACSLGALGMGACGDSEPPPPAPVAKKAVAAAAQSETAALKTPGYVYSYNPTGKRDPFRSPEADRVVAAAAGAACTEPLCQYDLDQLTLVAVVTGDADPVAMVEDPFGRGFIVHRNTRMGKQGGKVTQILHDSITVMELFATPDGKYSPNPITIALKKDKNEADMDLLTGRTMY